MGAVVSECSQAVITMKCSATGDQQLLLDLFLHGERIHCICVCVCDVYVNVLVLAKMNVNVITHYELK